MDYRYLTEEKSAVFFCDRVSGGGRIRALSCRFNVNFETLQELADFIVNECDNYTIHGKELFVEHQDFNYQFELGLINSYNPDRIDRIINDLAIAGDFKSAEEVDRWLSNNPLQAIYENNTRVGLMGDITYDVKDKEGFFDRLVSVIEETESKKRRKVINK